LSLTFSKGAFELDGIFHPSLHHRVAVEMKASCVSASPLIFSLHPCEITTPSFLCSVHDDLMKYLPMIFYPTIIIFLSKQISYHTLPGTAVTQDDSNTGSITSPTT